MKNILKWIGGVLLMLFVALGKVCKVSKVAERNLNHATQMTEINVNKAVKATTKMSKNSNIQRGVIIGVSRAVHNTTRSNAQTTSQPRMVNCTRCNGRGRVQSNDGYVYSCSRCNGTGTIFIK